MHFMNDVANWQIDIYKHDRTMRMMSIYGHSGVVFSSDAPNLMYDGKRSIIILSRRNLFQTGIVVWGHHMEGARMVAE